MSSWKLIIQHINNLKIEKETLRPFHLRNNFYISYSTSTSYINYLHQAMFLKRIRRGVYVRIKDIPIDLTIEKIKKFVYLYDYKKRKELIERYWRIQDIKKNIK